MSTLEPRCHGLPSSQKSTRDLSNEQRFSLAATNTVAGWCAAAVMGTNSRIPECVGPLPAIRRCSHADAQAHYYLGEQPETVSTEMSVESHDSGLAGLAAPMMTRRRKRFPCAASPEMDAADGSRALCHCHHSPAAYPPGHQRDSNHCEDGNQDLPTVNRHPVV